MIDPQALLRNFSTVQHALVRRGWQPEAIATLADHAEARRGAVQAVEALRTQQNQATGAVQAHLRAGDEGALTRARAELQANRAAIKAAEATLQKSEAALQEALLRVPNLPEVKVPQGAHESDNVELRRVGTPQARPFVPRPHWEVAENLGIADFARAAYMSGPRFAVLLGAGAALERALAALMLQLAREAGHTEVSPPLLVRPQSMQNAGQYPKFLGESFETQERELVLAPTSEVSLVNLHQNDLFAAQDLPRRYTAFTPCFRREAGAAGRDTRGLIRQHQFYKVELVSFCTPEQSEAEHLRITANAERVLQALKLPYRVIELCSGDLGFAARRTYDLEVWLPGQNAYREISSCSNCGDFQARRAAIRYRPEGDKKARPQLVHTLNGSALAVGRTLLAVLENYQEADGTVRVPDVLQPFLGGQTHIERHAYPQA